MKFMVKVPYAPGNPVKKWAKEVVGLNTSDPTKKGMYQIEGRFLQPGGYVELEPGAIVLIGWNPLPDTRAACLLRLLGDGTWQEVCEVDGSRIADRLIPDIRRLLNIAGSELDELRQALLTMVRILQASPHLAGVAQTALANHNLKLEWGAK